MTTKYNIYIIILLSVTMIISSCKKEEDSIQVIYGCTDATAFNYNPYANTDDGSCEANVAGCTDVNAMNFISIANVDDESCVYAYDIAQGEWNIQTVCEDLVISIPLVGDYPVPLNDMFPSTVDITGEGQGIISIDINGTAVLADVANDGAVVIQDGQKISIDTQNELIGEVDVDITGSGVITSATNGDLTLYLSFEIPLAGEQTSSCDIIFTR